MKTFDIELTSMSDELKNWINEGLGRHAMAMTGHDEKSSPIALLARDEQGSYIGAIIVEIFWGALHIKNLYMEDTCRSQGLASKLMQRALDYGREKKCPFAYVETLSFQALGFYQKMGFVLEFTRQGYKHGASFHDLRKDLI